MQSTPAFLHRSAPFTEGTTCSQVNPADLIFSRQGTGSPAEVKSTLKCFFIAGFSSRTRIAVSIRICDMGRTSADTITLIPKTPPLSFVSR